MINLEKEIRQQPSVLAGIGDVNAETVKKIVAEAKKRNIKNVTFAARGSSDHAAIYGQYLLGTAAGLPCGLATPSVISKYGKSIDYSDHLLIGISQSGMAEDVIEVINDAKKCGALTVSVTNASDSPLARDTDYSLFCNAGAETSIAATKTFTSELYIMAMLASEWSGDAELSAMMATLPSQTEKLLSYMPDVIDSFIGRYKGLKAASVIGRGLLYPIALEGALKILETNKIKMRGYAVSDFHHGPKAQIGKGDLAIVLACRGPVYGDAKSMIDSLSSVGADIIVITDTEDGFPASHILRLPAAEGKYSDAAAAFTAVITMQLIALKLTEVKKIDPDASKVLKKVTVTV